MRTNQNALFRKYLLTTLLVVFILAGSVFGYFYYANSAPDPSCGNLQSGDIVRLDGDSYWYWLDGERKLIIVASHLLSSWGKVAAPKIITAKCFDSLDVSAKKVNYRPGTYLLKYNKSNQLYAVLPGNKFAKISSTTASQLYGNYNPVSLNGFWWMNIIDKTAEITDSTPHPGMLISSDDKKTIYYVDENNKLHLVTANGFTANGFNKTFVHNISSLIINQMAKAGTISQALTHLLDKTQETTSSYPVVVVPTPTSTYSLTASATSVNEGGSVTFTLTTTNVLSSTNVNYTISGVSNSDLSSGSLTGNFLVNNNKATLTLTLVSDTTTEGVETITLSLTNGKASVIVTANDTSLTPIIPPPTTYGITYYVRTDGGTATQCDGKTNVAFSTSIINKACAWKHPFVALPPGGTAKIAGGDTLIIGNGSYKMGYGASAGAEICYSAGSYDCVMPPIPSGPSADRPTRILGQNWNNGCSISPELFGSQRPWYIVNLGRRNYMVDKAKELNATGSNNVELQCLEITDHSGCVESHSNSAHRCNRDVYPYGDWASHGIYAENSKNVLLKNLNIHGLANRGVMAGRLTDWTVENVKIKANGWAGWEGDIDNNGPNSGNFGTMTFKKVIVEWNGCGETYPGLQPTGCWGQTAGGYGDGLGTGTTGGNWIIEDSTFSHNTSDGLDLLYHTGGGTVTIKRVHTEGNAGNQLKTNGNATITDSVIIGNCGYFQGKPFTHNVDNCRALGNALSIALENTTAPVQLYNNSVYSEGDCNITSDRGTGSIKSRNNIFYAGTDFLQPFEKSCLAYLGAGVTFDTDYDITYQTKDSNEYCANGGSHNQCNKNPMFTSVDAANFNLLPQSTSPAIDKGYWGSGITAFDYLSRTRPQGGYADIGAYEVK